MSIRRKVAQARIRLEMLSKQLKILGMSSPEAKVTKDFVPRPRVPTDPPFSLENLREAQGDILGHYCHNRSEPEVILYADSCLRAAKNISTSVEGLLHVVLVHELAHHSTASGIVKDNCGTEWSWEDYGECDEGTWPGVHEYFAQALAFVCVFEKHAEPLEALRRLSKHQSPIYRTWEVLDAFARNNVGLQFIQDSLKAQFLALMRAKQGRRNVEFEDMHTITGYDE
jgi:hypothetical protein